MENFMTHIVAITILLFLLITFLQSGIDKIADWKGNLNWLKEHFSATFLSKTVPLLLSVVLVTEMITAVLCIIGIYQLIVENNSALALWAMFMACITLLMLLFGQRVVKDYQGALTITCYFIVAIFGLYSIAS